MLKEKTYNTKSKIQIVCILKKLLINLLIVYYAIETFLIFKCFEFF